MSSSRAWLTLSSMLNAIRDPRRADQVAAVGELTGRHALQRMRERMLESETGRKLLQNRQRLTADEVDIERLRHLPESTFGRHLIEYMDKYEFDPFQRPQVQYVDDDELAYVMQRYRQVHDLGHALADLPPTVLGEVAIKWMELVQTGLPMTAFAGVFGPLRLSLSEQAFLATTLLPWAARVGTHTPFMLSVDYERMFEEDIQNVRRKLHFTPAPEIPEDLDGWANECITSQMPYNFRHFCSSEMQQERENVVTALQAFRDSR
eukprot:gb/GECG01004298.1/.p1 GENE.gb/GECG01004298.1/~~gb/GECG01004298.1/.p1  ORF type:complete len:263 (+),score=30.12 gb/GECG01004298.1/:1-789(+)